MSGATQLRTSLRFQLSSEDNTKRSFGEKSSLESHYAIDHRQQELLIVVAAAMDFDARAWHTFHGTTHPARCT